MRTRTLIIHQTEAGQSQRSELGVTPKANGENGTLKCTQFQRRVKKTKKRWDKQETNSKMANISPIILYVNGLNI